MPWSKYNSTITGLSGNVNYHFNRLLEIPKNWDFYAGLNLGYYFWSTNSNYPGTGSSGPGLGAQIGGRYYINNNFGLNLEVGAGNAFSEGKFGISYRNTCFALRNQSKKERDNRNLKSGCPYPKVHPNFLSPAGLENS